MLLIILTLLVGLFFILLGAELFTNSVEWLGKRLDLGEGAVGSIFAAMGTALPETMIPVIALVFSSGGAKSEGIGIGAILGAPFMLSTLALFVAGITKFTCAAAGRERCRAMNVDVAAIKRDLSYFLGVLAMALLTAFINFHPLKIVIAVGLIFTYVYYVKKTLDESGESKGGNPAPLLLDRKVPAPGIIPILVQLALSLAIIIGVAHVFVGALERLSLSLGISPFILTLLIAPVATELPEQFNSVIWIKHGKDILALGNITGAMVFQSTLLPALGILLTPWKINYFGIVSVVMALASALVVFLYLEFKDRLSYKVLLCGGVFYGSFLSIVLTSTNVG